VNARQRLCCGCVQFVLNGTISGQNRGMTTVEQLVAEYLRLGVRPEAALAQLSRKGGIAPAAALKQLVDAAVAAGLRGGLTPVAAADRIRLLAHLHHGQTGVCEQLAVLVGLAAAWQTDIPQRLALEQKMLQELRRIDAAGGLQITPRS
jgi:acyl transferase domain-containing protein